MLESCRPLSVTVPLVGLSRPPSKCSKVDLPEPDAPTIAKVWPACTDISTPVSTCTSRSPSWKRRVSAWPCRTNSLITQSLSGLHTTGAIARVDSCHEGQDQGNDGDRDHVTALRIAGHVVDQVNA